MQRCLRQRTRRGVSTLSRVFPMRKHLSVARRGMQSMNDDAGSPPAPQIQTAERCRVSRLADMTQSHQHESADPTSGEQRLRGGDGHAPSRRRKNLRRCSRRCALAPRTSRAQPPDCARELGRRRGHRMLSARRRPRGMVDAACVPRAGRGLPVHGSASL